MYRSLRLGPAIALVALAVAACGKSPASLAGDSIPAATPITGPARPGEPAGSPAEAAPALTAFPFDRFTRHASGELADPCNLVFFATEAQFREAARRGGWLHADPITAWTSLKLVNAALRHRPYPTAPMSYLFLFGRPHDIGLQIPTRDVAVRDHFRVWETGIKDRHGRPAWVGAGTKDIAIKLEPGTNRTSHQIDPKLDDERETIVATFVQTGLVARTYRVPGIGHRFEGVNATGDPFYTDGMVAVLELQAFPAPEPKKKKKRR